MLTRIKKTDKIELLCASSVKAERRAPEWQLNVHLRNFFEIYGSSQRSAVSSSQIVKVCTCGSVYIFRTHASKTKLAREWLLLENVVDENLQGHEENDDDEVALLEEGAAFCSADGATPQHDDAPETRRTLERG